MLLQASSEPTTVAAGVGMVLLATASMLGAAVVLLVTKPALLRGVAIQGVAPLLAILSVAVRMQPVGKSAALAWPPARRTRRTRRAARNRRQRQVEDTRPP